MAWFEKDHNDHPVPTPCYVQGHQPADQAAQSHIQPGLECLQGWGIHSLLGQPVQCITTLWVKNFFLISNLNLPCLSLKPFPHVLSLSTLVNSRYPSCLYAPSKSWKAAMRSPHSLLFSKLNKHSSPSNKVPCFNSQRTESAESGTTCFRVSLYIYEVETTAEEKQSCILSHIGW